MVWRKMKFTGLWLKFIGVSINCIFIVQGLGIHNSHPLELNFISQKFIGIYLNTYANIGENAFQKSFPVYFDESSNTIAHFF